MLNNLRRPARGIVGLFRGLLLLLACLIAALPGGWCLCTHEHEPTAEQHEHDVPAPHDECQCQDSPREATIPPAPAVDADIPLSLPLRSADLTLVLSHVIRPAFRTESPPGQYALPLYLSVNRLLI